MRAFRTVATYGKGPYLVKFFFLDRLNNKFENVSVTIKGQNRTEIANILEKYKQAIKYVKDHPLELCYPQNGYRYMALREANAWLLSVTEDNIPLIREIIFFKPRQDFMARASK